MKLTNTKNKMGNPPEDDNPKKKKVLLSLKKEVKGNNYGKYSGVVDENGKRIDKPTEGQAMKTMINYMKNNKSNQSDEPSNVYRPEFEHQTVNYDRKKGNTKA